MAIPFLSDVDFQQNELQNAVLQNLASAPANPGSWSNVLQHCGKFNVHIRWYTMGNR